MLEFTLDCAPKKTEAEKAMMRQAFEAYSAGQRNLSLEAAISTASMTYKAVAAAGPVGLLVIPVGLLKAWWSKKSYRDESYAFFDAMGWTEPVPPGYIDPWTGLPLGIDLAKWSRPFGGGCMGDVIYAVIEILYQNYPTLTVTELHSIGQATRETFEEHRLRYQDVPQEVTAEVILAAHGIYREPAGDGLVYDPGRGDEVAPEADEPKPDEPYIDWLYAAAGLAAALIFTRR